MLKRPHLTCASVPHFFQFGIALLRPQHSLLVLKNCVFCCPNFYSIFTISYLSTKYDPNQQLLSVNSETMLFCRKIKRRIDLYIY
jgi:hypothetical protein